MGKMIALEAAKRVAELLATTALDTRAIARACGVGAMTVVEIRRGNHWSLSPEVRAAYSAAVKRGRKTAVPAVGHPVTPEMQAMARAAVAERIVKQNETCDVGAAYMPSPRRIRRLCRKFRILTPRRFEYAPPPVEIMTASEAQFHF